MASLSAAGPVVAVRSVSAELVAQKYSMARLMTTFGGRPPVAPSVVGKPKLSIVLSAVKDIVNTSGQDSKSREDLLVDIKKKVVELANFQGIEVAPESIDPVLSDAGFFETQGAEIKLLPTKAALLEKVTANEEAVLALLGLAKTDIQAAIQGGETLSFFLRGVGNQDVVTGLNDRMGELMASSSELLFEAAEIAASAQAVDIIQKASSNIYEFAKELKDGSGTNPVVAALEFVKIADTRLQ